MRADHKKILIALVAPFFLSACGNGQQQGGVAPTVKVDTASVKKVEAEAAIPVVEAKKSEPPLKNPFQSDILLKRGEVGKTVMIKGPLECCEIATFKVVAALVAGEKPYALLSGTDNKRYIVRIGDRMGLNGGKIVTITTSGITVRETLKDIDGNVVNVNDVTLNVNDVTEEPAAPGAPKNTRR